MSKSIKHEKTRPYLDQLAMQRKLRQSARDIKTAFLNEVEDMFYNVPFAQDF